MAELNIRKAEPSFRILFQNDDFVTQNRYNWEMTCGIIALEVQAKGFVRQAK